MTCGTGGKKTRKRTCDHAGAAYCGGGQDNEESACSGPLCLVDGEKYAKDRGKTPKTVEIF